jgi:ribose 5-phosphate isomerase A
MDLKKEAARAAFTLVKNNSSVGLGDGVTIRWLAGYIIEGIKNGLTIKLYTSSLQTQDFLLDAGMTVLDFSSADELDQYFDGCDQVDSKLNALKSGAGIHTTEKLLASMAKKFIIIADATKFVSKLENKFPLVLEVLPQATLFVLKQMKEFFPGTTLLIRAPDGKNSPAITRNGNYLVDCRFQELPELEFLQQLCKNITGVVETSLFYKIAHEAIIVDDQGVRWFERKNDLVIMTNHPRV